MVSDFFHKAVDRDVGGVCDLLTGRGRAQAAGHWQIVGKPRMAVSRERCVVRRARGATVSEDLPHVVDALRVRGPHIAGDRAWVMVCIGAGCRPQLLDRTDDGWKIDEFQLPVND